MLKHIEWTIGILLVVLVLGAGVMYSGQVALGVFLGGMISTMSFQVLKWQLRKAFNTPGKVPRKAGLFASYYVRFLATLFAVFTVMYYGWAGPIPFLVGLSVVVLSIVVVGGREYFIMFMKKGES